MDNAIQLFNAGTRARRTLAESGLGQFAAVHSAVVVENLAAEMRDYLVVNVLSGLHELVGDLVRLNEVRAESDQHLSDYGFSGCDPAGEANFQQALPARKPTTETRRH